MLKKVIKWIGLYLAALIVFIPLSIIGIVYTIIKHTIKLDYNLKQVIRIFKGLAITTDIMANVCAGELLNDIKLIDLEKGTKYGKPHETISFITGRNELNKTLLERGWKLTNALSKVLGKNHSIEAVTSRKYE